MRIGLISLLDNDAGRELPRTALIRHCGLPVAAHQSDMALAGGCEKLIYVIDDQTQADAEALKRRTADAGVTVVFLKRARDLRAHVTASDELLVLAAGLLPGPRLFRQITTKPGVATFPADWAVPAGFERIDREVAWAGVLVTRGAVVEGLSELDDDIDLVAALLRLTLQSGTQCRKLDETEFEEGDWLFANDADALAAREARWYRGNADAIDFRAPGIAIAETAGARLARDIIGTRYQTLPSVLAISMLMAALMVSAFGWLVAGFILAGAAFLFARAGRAVHRLTHPVGGKRIDAPVPVLEYLCDVTLGVLLIQAGSETVGWLRAFVPVMLFAALYLFRVGRTRGWRLLVEDRFVLSAVLAGTQLFEMAFAAAAAITFVTMMISLWEQRAEIMAD